MSEGAGAPQLALGTAQFGLAYGVSGLAAPVPEKEIRSILASAAERGVRTLDTAAAYGDLEARLGKLIHRLPFEVVSKIPAIPAAMSPAQAAEFAVVAARQSRQRLGWALKGLILHQGRDLLGTRGEAIASALKQWAAKENVSWGASCYAPSEALALSRRHGITLAQVPANALDQRIVGVVGTDARAEFELHLRSLFLQGLLLMPEAEAAKRVPRAAMALRLWHAWCAEQGLTPLDAALGVAKSFRVASRLIVGVDSLKHWEQVADAWARSTPAKSFAHPSDDPRVIDPRNWPSLPGKRVRVALIQARMSSSRFPGKVLEPLGGLPMIVYMARRVMRARHIDRVVVATSAASSDDVLAQVLNDHGVECYRGDLDDVLARFYAAARSVSATHVVRLTGDCPLIDADLIDAAVDEVAQGHCDYVTNSDPPTHPDGLCVEAFTMVALEKAWQCASLKSEREHVTPYMRKPEAGLRLKNLLGFTDLSEMRWTVDYPDDLEHVRDLVAATEAEGMVEYDRFLLYRLIEKYSLTRQESHMRDEGYARSLVADGPMNSAKKR